MCFLGSYKGTCPCGRVFHKLLPRSKDVVREEGRRLIPAGPAVPRWKCATKLTDIFPATVLCERELQYAFRCKVLVLQAKSTTAQAHASAWLHPFQLEPQKLDHASLLGQPAVLVPAFAAHWDPTLASPSTLVSRSGASRNRFASKCQALSETGSIDSSAAALLAQSCSC